MLSSLPEIDEGFDETLPLFSQIFVMDADRIVSINND